jgi:hypothetical protein
MLFTSFGEAKKRTSLAHWSGDAAKFHDKGIVVKHAVRKSRTRQKKEDINKKLTELKNEPS